MGSMDSKERCSLSGAGPRELDPARGMNEMVPQQTIVGGLAVGCSDAEAKVCFEDGEACAIDVWEAKSWHSEA